MSNFKPKGYWNNKSRCEQEAKRFDTRRAFEKGSNGAFDSSYRNGWLDEVCSHMPDFGDTKHSRVNLNGNAINYKWTKERYTAEALLYETIGEFRKYSRGAYNAAKRNGDISSVKKHMTTRKIIDVVYMWNTIEYPCIWKIGVSNTTFVGVRINKVISQADLTLGEVRWIQCKNAYTLEAELLGYGDNATIYGIVDGRTELRYLSEENEQKVKSTLESNGSVKYNITSGTFDSLFEG